MSEYNMTHTGAELDAAVAKVQSGYILPSGTKNITANGTVDVADYASANINVPVPDGYIKISDTETYVTQHQFGLYTPTADISISDVSITVGFKPKIFIMRNHGGIAPASKAYVTTSFIVTDNNYNYFSEIVSAYSSTDAVKTRSTMSGTSSAMSGSQGSSNGFHIADNGVVGIEGSNGKSTLYLKKGIPYLWYAWG